MEEEEEEEEEEEVVLLKVLVGVEGALPGWGVGRVLLERIGTGLISPPAGGREESLTYKTRGKKSFTHMLDQSDQSDRSDRSEQSLILILQGYEVVRGFVSMRDIIHTHTQYKYKVHINIHTWVLAGVRRVLFVGVGAAQMPSPPS